MQVFRVVLGAAVLAGAFAPGLAAAQYKIVDADGRVTYTDRPPTHSTAKVTEIRRNTPVATDAGPLAQLPLELRLLAQRYPVVLYSASDCGPCDNGRHLLTQRGIPFTEKRVASDEDVRNLERQFGWRTVPSLSIGAQSLRGYSGEEWQAFLDAAGYPKESRLPRPAAAPPAPAAASASAAEANRPKTPGE